MSAADKPSYQPGDWVEILGMHYGRGRVLAVDPRGRRVRVRIGDQDWTLKPDQLKPTAPPDPAERPRPVHGLHSTGAVQHQVDLHGMTVEEALLAAEKALDQALVSGLFQFKIIHGHGSGRLRQAVRAMLAGHPFVKDFRFGEPHEGGLACTVAFLRHEREP
ncbi:MAG TPA: Smr/MutS family protein [Candidatus Sumerlaeota bacterium]|nr:MAG: Endonuclease MutS2 [candidate division BRC1 bacterium ADurb.BinA292]HOE95079.1 Smr/MutS family protein [Candidatus Sumerlaeota bacterium]HOR26422.1 Smr/MutS family protein [Candidatus Sumerlaeota bacterium]HPK01878.1 Smr/MutS family protein [Candidatus Sumerlaeota bacterium]